MVILQIRGSPFNDLDLDICQGYNPDLQQVLAVARY